MARKVNINTFNPNAGVSIPGWATESYKGTVDTLENIVGDVTDTINQGRRDDMNFALEQSRIAQRKEEFKYQKSQNEYRDEKDFLDILLGDLDGSEVSMMSFNEIIGSRPSTDNERVSALRDVVGNKAIKKGEMWRNSSDSIRDMFFSGASDEELQESGNYEKFKSYQKQNMTNPEWNKALIKREIEQDFGGRLDPDYLLKGEAKILFDSMSETQKNMIGQPKNSSAYKKLEAGYNELRNNLYNLVQMEPGSGYGIDDSTANAYSQKTGTPIADVKRDFASGLLTEQDMLTAITDIDIEEEGEGFLDGIGDYISGIFGGEKPSEIIGPSTIAFNNREVKVMPGSEMIDEAGNKSYIVEYEDGDQDRVAYSAIKDQLPADFGKQEEPGILSQIASMEFPEEYKDRKGQFYKDKLKDSFVGLGDYLSGVTESVDKSIKDFEGEFKLLDTAPGKAVNNFLSYVDDIYKDVEDDSNPNLTSIGKEVNQIGKTIGRFFPQIAEDYQIFKSGQVDRYLTEGTSTVEAIKKARDDIRQNQGGVYYAKSSKYITKKQLIGQGNIIEPSEDFDADLARLPNKMINPKYIEDKVIELSASMAENVSKVSETSTAGPSLKKVKNDLSKTEKELRKLKQEIKEVDKYRAQGLFKITSSLVGAPSVYRISSEQIDNALETIKIAKSKRESRVKNPFPIVNEAERARVAKEDALNTQSAVSEMRDAEKILRDLLTEQALSNSGMFQSPNPNNPFGR